MRNANRLSTTALLVAAVLAGCAGGEITTREKGAGIGALGGAAAGGLIGAAVGRPGVGAAVGGVLGLGTEVYFQAGNAGDRAQGFFTIGLNGFTQRAGRRGQFHGKAYSAVVDAEFFDHPQADDIAVKFGVLDVAQRCDDLFLRNIFHEFPLDAKEL